MEDRRPARGARVVLDPGLCRGDRVDHVRVELVIRPVAARDLDVESVADRIARDSDHVPRRSVVGHVRCMEVRAVQRPGHEIAAVTEVLADRDQTPAGVEVARQDRLGLEHGPATGRVPDDDLEAGQIGEGRDALRRDVPVDEVLADRGEGERVVRLEAQAEVVVEQEDGRDREGREGVVRSTVVVHRRVPGLVRRGDFEEVRGVRREALQRESVGQAEPADAGRVRRRRGTVQDRARGRLVGEPIDPRRIVRDARRVDGGDDRRRVVDRRGGGLRPGRTRVIVRDVDRATIHHIEQVVAGATGRGRQLDGAQEHAGGVPDFGGRDGLGVTGVAGHGDRRGAAQVAVHEHEARECRRHEGALVPEHVAHRGRPAAVGDDERVVLRTGRDVDSRHGHRVDADRGIRDVDILQVVFRVGCSAGSTRAVREVVPQIHRPIGRGDRQVEVVHELRARSRGAGHIRPRDGHLDRLIDDSDRNLVRVRSSGRQGDRLVIVEVRCRGRDHIPEVKPAPAFVHVRDRAGGEGTEGRVRDRGHVDRAVHQGGLRDRRARIGSRRVPEVLYEQGRRAGDHRAGHARAAAVDVERVDVLPAPVRVRLARERGRNPSARSNDVRLDPAVRGRAAAAEADRCVEVIGRPGARRRDRRPEVQRGAGRDHVFGVAGAPGALVDRRAAAPARVACGELEDERLVPRREDVRVSDEAIIDHVIDEVGASILDAPAIAVDGSTVVQGVGTERVVARVLPRPAAVEDALVDDVRLRRHPEAPEEAVRVACPEGAVARDDTRDVRPMAEAVRPVREGSVPQVRDDAVVEFRMHVSIHVRVVDAGVHARVIDGDADAGSCVAGRVEPREITGR